MLQKDLKRQIHRPGRFLLPPANKVLTANIMCFMILLNSREHVHSWKLTIVIMPVLGIENIVINGKTVFSFFERWIEITTISKRFSIYFL